MRCAPPRILLTTLLFATSAHSFACSCVGLHRALYQHQHKREISGLAFMSAEPRDKPRKYRPCAGAIVFNKHKQLLLGERKDKAGAWQLPQGGIEEGESAVEAAARELFEETGLREPTVKTVKALSETHRYDVPGNTWLRKAGFCGQEMHWTLFLYPSDGLPPVNLNGIGEPAEFTRVKWSSWEELILRSVDFKKQTYEDLSKLAAPEIEEICRSL
eukprot:747964-Hanusia_phi.AAC.5